MKIENKNITKLTKGQMREERRKSGYFDGRFKHRVEVPKNKYSRKTRHKK